MKQVTDMKERIRRYDTAIDDAGRAIAAAQRELKAASRYAFDGGVPLIENPDRDNLVRVGVLLTVADQLLGGMGR